MISLVVFTALLAQTNDLETIRELINKHEFDSAKHLLNAAGNNSNSPELDYTFGMYFMKRNLPDSALFYGEKALEKTPSSDSSLVADIQNVLGGCYYQKADYSKSLESYLAAARFYEEENSDKLGIIYVNLGIILSALERFEESMEYQRKAFDYIPADDIQSIFFNLVNLSVNHRRMEQMDSSFIYLQRALQLSKDNEFKPGIIQAYASLANMHLRNQEYEQAIDMAESVLNDKESSDRAKAQAAYVIASAYNELEQPYKALAPAQESLRIVESLGMTGLIASLHELLYEIELKSKNYQAALDHYTIYHSIEDSINRSTNIKQLNELELQYETEKKDNQIQFLNQEKSLAELELKQRNFQLYGSIVLAIVLISFGLLYFRQRTLRSQLSIDQLNQKLLKSQLNPHFLFNALNAIQQQILVENDKTKAADYLARFSQMTRQILETNRLELVTLEEEIMLLENYVELQKLRSSNTITVTINVDDELEIDRIKIPPMLTQPLVENAFEHGLLPKKAEGNLIIKFNASEHQLIIQIMDDGDGINSQKKEGHTSVSKQVTMERLQLLEKQTGKKSSLNFSRNQQDLHTFTVVTLSIPLL